MDIYTVLLMIHIIVGGFCLLLGMINLIVRKQRGKHTVIGEWYHGAYIIVFLTSVFMAVLHWSESAYLFYIALFSYGLALLGYVAGKIRWKGWIQSHIGGMAGSFIGIITAVLVVNGADIPVINDIPILLIWFLPTIIGTPIITIVGRRYQKLA